MYSDQVYAYNAHELLIGDIIASSCGRPNLCSGLCGCFVVVVILGCLIGISVYIDRSARALSKLCFSLVPLGLLLVVLFAIAFCSGCCSSIYSILAKSCAAGSREAPSEIRGDSNSSVNRGSNNENAKSLEATSNGLRGSLHSLADRNPDNGALDAPVAVSHDLGERLHDLADRSSNNENADGLAGRNPDNGALTPVATSNDLRGSLRSFADSSSDDGDLDEPVVASNGLRRGPRYVSMLDLIHGRPPAECLPPPNARLVADGLAYRGPDNRDLGVPVATSDGLIEDPDGILSSILDVMRGRLPGEGLPPSTSIIVGGGRVEIRIGGAASDLPPSYTDISDPLPLYEDPPPYDAPCSVSSSTGR